MLLLSTTVLNDIELLFSKSCFSVDLYNRRYALLFLY